MFPRGLLGGDRPSHEAAIPKYDDHLYGVTELGGTQVRYISGVPYEKLGLPKLSKQSFAQVSEGMQHSLYKGLMAPIVLLGGLAVFVRRSTRRHEGEN